MGSGVAQVNVQEQGFSKLMEVLHQLGIFIGGSLASSVHGIARMTMDIDLVTALRRDQAAAFVQALGSDFYADEETIAGALSLGRPFNIIHMPSAYKYDLFPLTASAFLRSEMARKQTLTIRPLGEAEFSVNVASVEDILLAKLDWFRAGGRASDQAPRNRAVCGRVVDANYFFNAEGI